MNNWTGIDNKELGFYVEQICGWIEPSTERTVGRKSHFEVGCKFKADFLIIAAGPPHGLIVSVRPLVLLLELGIFLKESEQTKDFQTNLSILISKYVYSRIIIKTPN